MPPKVPAQKVYHCTTGARLYTVSPEGLPADTAVARLLAAYRDSLRLKMEEIIVFNKAPLSKTQPESTLGNWISDAVKNQAFRRGLKADICLFNYGCIGKEYLAPGPVRRHDFYELIPFENKMVLVSLSGSALRQLCDSIARINGIPLSGLSFTIDSGRACHIRVGAHPLHDHRIYTVLLNDYLLSRYNTLLGKIRSRNKPAGLSLRGLLLEESEQLQRQGIPVHAVLEKRIAYAE